VSETVVVIPCYNEADRLPVDAIRDYLRRSASVSLLFVNDGSRDATAEVLDRLASELPGQMAVHTLFKNQGKAEAVRQGMLAALERQPRFVGYWDADLATPLAEIDRFREILRERPQLLLAMGARVRLLGRRIERSAIRHYLGRVFGTCASLALAMPVYDTQCGAKLFRVTTQLPSLFATPFRSRWIFDVELLARLRKTCIDVDQADVDERICEVPLECWRDVRGSKLRPWHILGAGWQLLRIYFGRLSDRGRRPRA
jgi:glycosyltransferase involved in cell wall biosynthesis